MVRLQRSRIPSSVGGAEPSSGTTTAVMSSPMSAASLMPSTATSATPGQSSTAASTSRAETLNPADLMMSTLSRPSSCHLPVPSLTVATSPVRNQGRAAWAAPSVVLPPLLPGASQRADTTLLTSAGATNASAFASGRSQYPGDTMPPRTQSSPTGAPSRAAPPSQAVPDWRWLPSGTAILHSTPGRGLPTVPNSLSVGSSPLERAMPSSVMP
mmetsp:Transcript_20140/g.77257  ORF Transcript_20140/g.77257 Transcript_20140/m.77257 type:complete len:213 (-) Transcript_20140:1136-1774(-)